MSTQSHDPRTADAITAATGFTWSDWVAWLDAHEGRGLAHPGIAALAHERMSAAAGHEVKSAGWWSQSVAVAYEQQIGRRGPGQRQDGTFSVSVSRTVPVEPSTVLAAWQVHASRADHLAGCTLAGPARTSVRSRRLYWHASCSDGTAVQVVVEPRRAGSKVTVMQEGLASRAAREEARKVFRIILAELSFPAAAESLA